MIPTANELLCLLVDALESARMLGSEKPKDRSGDWIEALAQKLEAFFSPAQPDVETFRKTKKATRFNRGKKEPRSEYLFDILCCQMSTFRPPVHPTAAPIDYVVAPLVQVESEFAPDTAASAEDFSKLVCGSAPLSLFVGPLPTTGPKNYLNAMAHIAPRVKGDCYAAFVPHPEVWSTDPRGVDLYSWRDAKWSRVPPSRVNPPAR